MPHRIGSCCKNIKTRNEAGLTLLEVLASLAIVALLVAVLSEFLFNGVRLWAGNDRGYQRQHRVREIYLTLDQDISTAVIGSYLPSSAFQGGETELSFWREDCAGLLKIQYRFDPREKVVTRVSGFWGGEPAPQILFKNITTWKFEYYQSDTENWLPEWDFEDPNQIPSLIRISLTTEKNQVGPLVIPVKAWHAKVNDDVSAQ